MFLIIKIIVIANSDNLYNIVLVNCEGNMVGNVRRNSYADYHIIVGHLSNRLGERGKLFE